MATPAASAPAPREQSAAIRCGSVFSLIGVIIDEVQRRLSRCRTSRRRHNDDGCPASGHPSRRRWQSDPAVAGETCRLRCPLLAPVLDLVRGQIQHHPIRTDALDRRLRQIDLVEAAEPVLEQAGSSRKKCRRAAGMSMLGWKMPPIVPTLSPFALKTSFPLRVS